MAADMVFQLHGMALRQLSLALDVHCQGLAQASRLARGRSLISNGLARRLLQLDAADNVCRHITAPYVTGFLAELPQVGGISVNGSVGDVDDGGVGSKAARFDISGKLLNLASGSSFAGDTNDFQKDMATASFAEVDSLEVNDDGSHVFDKEHNAGSTGEPCSSEVYDKHDDIKEQHSDTGNETVANSTVMHEVNNSDDIVDQFCLGLATGENLQPSNYTSPRTPRTSAENPWTPTSTAATKIIAVTRLAPGAAWRQVSMSKIHLAMMRIGSALTYRSTTKSWAAQSVRPCSS